MESIKQIDIKNRTYNFFNEMQNIKNFDSHLIKTDKKSYKNIVIYYIGYIAVKYFEHDGVHTVSPLYFIIDGVDGYIEGKMKINAYFLSLQIRTKVKTFVEKINEKPGKCGKNIIKIKFESDDNPPLNKNSIMKLYNLAIAVRSAFQGNKKYYPQFFK